MTGGVSVVIPTVGRSSLAALLRALAPTPPAEMLVVDDRRNPVGPLPIPAAAAAHTKVLAGPGAGPAAARNAGWRAARQPWVVFLDDDVVPEPDWTYRLAADLDVPETTAGVQGLVRVPLPPDRPPTDWERVTAGLAQGRWITADMAYRRRALAAVGGFDERFPRAFREDAELAYRIRLAGWALARGRRRVTHPVRPEGPWVSVRIQRGNADDALLRRLYGPRWRDLLDVPPGRRRRHAAVTAAGVIALACAGIAAARPAGRGGTPATGAVPAIVAALAGAGWLAGTAEFAAARIRPGPRSPAEIAIMAVTSVAIPPVAVSNWLLGWWRARGARPVAART